MNEDEGHEHDVDFMSNISCNIQSELLFSQELLLTVSQQNLKPRSRGDKQTRLKSEPTYPIDDFFI